MIFTFYLDEANTHGPAPTVMMGALLGHAYQWQIFGRDIDRIRKRYGFTVFHSKRFQARRGEFKDWDDEKCRNLAKELAVLVRDKLTEGATIHLERDRYLREYRNKPFPLKMQPDSQFGLCFRALLAHMLDIVATTGKKPILHVVVEDGHKNVGSCRTIVNEVKKRLRRKGIEILGTVTIAKKTESTELMISDFLAHTYYLMRSDLAPGEEWDYDDPPEESAMASLRFSPSSFDDLKKQFELEKQVQMDEWRQRKAAKKASSSGGQSS